MENNKITQQDVLEVMKSMDPDFVWPIYDEFGNVIVTSKDKEGITWVVTMSAESFHNAIQNAVDRQFGDSKAE